MPLFEPSHWTARGAVMPSLADSIVPTGASAVFNGALYVSEQGQWGNVGGYPYANMNIAVGAVVRTEDGVAWTVAWDGRVASLGQRQWMPGQLFVIGDALYCFIFALAWAYVDPWAILGPGEVALMRTTDGTTWTKVQTFHTWTEKNHGSGSAFSKEARGSGCAWHARRSSAGGDDWLIVGWSVRCDGSTGTFFEAATRRYRSADGGLTWTLVADMKGVPPFASNPGTLDAPAGVQPIWRSTTLGDRWFMFGGTGALNWSDDEGATWTVSSWSGLTPGWTYPLMSGGLVLFTNGSFIAGPDVKVSCNLGESFSVVPLDQTYQGEVPAQAGVATVQFALGDQGEGGEELLALARLGETTSTGIWYSTTGGESWTLLGTLATLFTVPAYAARTAEGRIVVYTASRASAGGPQVWTCDDQPAGVAGTRTICTDLTPIAVPKVVAPIGGCGPLFTTTFCAPACPPAPPALLVAARAVAITPRARRAAALLDAPVAALGGCGATFVNELCGAPYGPVPAVCTAPLGAFVLGGTCLGAPLGGPAALGRHARARRSH